MADDDTIAQFTSITSAAPERAQQYLTLADGDLESAIQLYFENDGADMGATVSDATRSFAPAAPAQPPSQPDPGDPIQIDSDNESEGGIPIVSSGGSSSAQRPQQQQDPPPSLPSTEDDEAMARRMQEEIYSSGAGEGTGPEPMGLPVDPETGVRAPISRTTETLADPGPQWRYNEADELHAAVREQILGRTNRRGSQRPGIFNQRPPPSSAIWEDGENHDDEQHRQDLALATGGASENSSKSSRLAELYRPPFELMSPLKSWDGVRADGKEKEKWILVNVQDSNVFDCQVLNRDIWKNAQIRDTVRENFIFKQFTKDDPQAANYIRYYFHAAASQDAYPHIAIVDPRTGEQVKVWSGAPVPKPEEFLEQLHEFLDRYSLKANSRNPVATRKAEKKTVDVDKMTEEQMLEMALQNSLEGAKPGPKDEDPDTLTRAEGGTNGAAGAAAADDAILSSSDANGSTLTSSPFGLISSAKPHDEPAADEPNTTRIQFRHPGGRIIRRFGLQEPVRRIYEWLKASPLEGKEGQAFELIFMGKNLIDAVDGPIEAAGLKNGSVMVEFVEGA